MGEQDGQLQGQGGGEASTGKGPETVVFDGDSSILFDYVRDMADHMGLCAWHLDLGVEDRVPSSNHRYAVGTETVASCAVAHGTQRASIIFASFWPTMSPYDVRHMVVHELVHCHVEKMSWAFNNVQTLVGGSAMFQMLLDAYDDMQELAVDTIAMAWAQLLPLPGEPFGTED